MWTSCSKYKRITQKLWKMKFEAPGLKKIKFFKNPNFSFFFGSDVQPSRQLSTSIKPIGIEILPASICSMPCYFRKWGQIKIWTDGAMNFFNFCCLNLPICRRPHFSRFFWHRITLRGWMIPSCSTSHWKYKLIMKKL